MRAGEEVLHAIFFAVAYQGIPIVGMGPQGPHWEISPKEAKELDQAWVRMWRHYAPQVSEKTADIINFGTCAGRIVVPRAVQSVFDKKARAHAAMAHGARGAGMGHPNSPGAGPPLDSPAAPVTQAAAQPVATSPPTTTPAPAAPSTNDPVTPGQQDPLAMGLTHMTAMGPIGGRA